MNYEILLELYNKLPAELQTISIIVVIFLSYKGIIKIPWIPIGNVKKKSHANCPLYSDLLKREKIKEDIKCIREKILKEQLQVRDSKHINILFTMNTVYRGIATKLDQIKHYEKLVSKIEYKVLNPMIETWLRENHLTSKIDWKAYKDHNIELLLKTTIIELGDDYDERFFDVTADERSIANSKELIPAALQEWNNLFDECREIAREYEKKIMELEKQLEKNLG